MKKKLSKILGVGLTVVLLFSLMTMPVLATISGLALAVSPTTISDPATYTATFNLGAPLAQTTGKVIITFPTGPSIANISTVASYTTGTASFLSGQNTVTGGTGWTANMVGAKIRNTATTSPEKWYTVATWVDATALTLTTNYAEADAPSANYVIADVLVAATSGIGTNAFVATPADSTTSGQVLTIAMPAAIGTGALVQVQVAGVVNPGTVGTYSTLTVATSAETVAVTAPPFTTTPPAILPLPGIVERYNSVGVLMQQENKIQLCIAAASTGDSILVGPGTYDEAILVTKLVTITGNAATTIIMDTNKTGGTDGTVIISADGSATAGVVFDGFTVMGNLIANTPAMKITGDKVTVQNCVFTKAGTATSNQIQTMIQYAPDAPPTLVSTITNNTFDTTLGTKKDIGIEVVSTDGTGLTISNNTFVVDGVYQAEDSAIDTSGPGAPLLPITISGNTITGGSGIGVTFRAGVATASDNTLMGLNQAFKIIVGTATIKGNAIDNCGLAISTTTVPATPVGQAAIGVTSTITALSITNNTITNPPPFGLLL